MVAAAVGGCITLVIFLVGQLVAAVIWGARIDTKMDYMISSHDDFKKLKEDLSTKTEVAMALSSTEKQTAVALAFVNKETTTMWGRVDDLNKRVLALEVGHK